MINWMLLEISINVFQGWLIVYFLEKMLTPVRNKPITDWACILAIAGWYTMYLFWDVPVLDTVIFALPFLYCCWACSEKWYYVLFWHIVLAIIFSEGTNLNISLYLGLMEASEDQIMGETPQRIAVLASTNLTLLIAVLVVTRFAHRAERLPWYSFIPLLALNSVCLLAVEFLFLMGKAFDLGSMFAYTCLCLFGISILSIALFEVIAKITHRQQQYALEVERLRMTRKYNQEMKNLYDDMAVFRHDMKHQMQVISQLASESDSKHLRQYITDLEQNVQSLQPFSTGNQAVDALLTAKTSLMRRQQIAFDFQPYPLDQLPVREGDFCAVLGNLLDNAIEGVARIPDEKVEKKIFMSFARTWNMFFVICKNLYDPNTIHYVHGILATSKNDAQHGLGTRSIRAIVEKANGDVRISTSEGLFTVIVTIPILNGEAPQND